VPDEDLLARLALREGGAAGQACVAPGDLVPHAPPVLALRRISEATSKSLVASVLLEQDGPFSLPGRGVPYWCALEFMSQAVAALEGLRARLRGEPPPVGYLLGTRLLRASTEYLPEAQEMEVRVEELLAHGEGFAAFDCCLGWSGGELRCRLSVFRESGAAR